MLDGSLGDRPSALGEAHLLARAGLGSKSVTVRLGVELVLHLRDLPPLRVMLALGLRGVLVAQLAHVNLSWHRTGRAATAQRAGTHKSSTHMPRSAHRRLSMPQQWQ